MELTTVIIILVVVLIIFIALNNDTTFNTTNTDSNTMKLLQEQCIERNDNVDSNGYLKLPVDH